MIFDIIALDFIAILMVFICLLESKEIKTLKNEINILKTKHNETNEDLDRVMKKWEDTIDHLKEMTEMHSNLVERNSLLTEENEEFKVIIKELNNYESD